MKNFKILLISYHFLPSLTARSIQISKFVKYLIRNGCDIDIITAKSGTGALEKGYDYQLMEKMNICDLNIIRLPDRCKRFISKIFTILFSLPFLFWYKNALPVVFNLLKQKKYNILFTNAYPFESHLFGLQIKKKYPNLFWVAYFSDPWSNSFENKAIIKKLTQILEKKVAEKADLIIFPSQELLNFVMRSYPSFYKKSIVIPHCYDEELFNLLKKENSNCKKNYNRIIFSSIGGFSRSRSPLFLLRALRILKKRNKKLLSKMHFRLIGSGVKQFKEGFMKISDNLSIEIIESVPYLESLKYMIESDYLVLLDLFIKENPHFPSKLADFIGSGTPIIGITSFDSCSSRIIRSFGYPVISPENPQMFAEILERLVNNKLNIIVKDDAKKYECTNVVRNFLEVISKFYNNRIKF